MAVSPNDTGTEALCRYELTHTRAQPTLRDHGSFLATIVDGIDDLLAAWNVHPPDAYAYERTVNGRHHYVGTLRIP